MQYDADTKNARMTATLARIDAGAAASRIDVGTAGMAAVLVSYALDNPGGVVTGDTLSFSGFPKTAVASASGVPAAARIVNGDGVTICSELTAGTVGTDIILDKSSITAGDNVSIAVAPYIQHAS